MHAEETEAKKEREREMMGIIGNASLARRNMCMLDSILPRSNGIKSKYAVREYHLYRNLGHTKKRMELHRGVLFSNGPHEARAGAAGYDTDDDDDDDEGRDDDDDGDGEGSEAEGREETDSDERQMQERKGKKRYKKRRKKVAAADKRYRVPTKKEIREYFKDIVEKRDAEIEDKFPSEYKVLARKEPSRKQKFSMAAYREGHGAESGEAGKDSGAGGGDAGASKAAGFEKYLDASLYHATPLGCVRFSASGTRRGALKRKRKCDVGDASEIRRKRGKMLKGRNVSGGRERRAKKARLAR